ncbi:hypothetical protein B0J17DRAFT_719003 [Rhizoctonia solani]|nr:hypothetical protein B0J17DRAFT_719003 [Rhizoctonia solani]
MFFFATQYVLASVASVALIRKALPVVKDAVRGISSSDAYLNTTDDHASSAYTLENATRIIVNLKSEVPARPGTTPKADTRPDKKTSTNAPTSKHSQPWWLVSGKNKPLNAPGPLKVFSKATNNRSPIGSLHRQRAQAPATQPNLSTTSVPVQGGPSTQASANTNPQGTITTVPSLTLVSAHYTVPFPENMSPPLRASRSAPARSNMSLSGLTYGPPTKRVRTTPTGPGTRHAPSSSGKPGALVHVTSLAHPPAVTQDVEMAAVDALEMPKVTKSQPDSEMEDLDQMRSHSPASGIGRRHEVAI